MCGGIITKNQEVKSMVLILFLFLQISPAGRFFTTLQDSATKQGIFISPGIERDTTTWFFVYYGGKFRMPNNFLIDIRVLFKHGNDSTYPFYNWHEIGEMDYTRALLCYQTKSFTLSWGLDSPTLSGGYFTKLFFDGFEPEFPQVQFSYRKKSLSFFYLIGQMEEVKSNPYKPTGDTKYFAYHEIKFNWRNLDFKFGEGVLFKNFNSSQPDWYLFTPLSIWYPRQANNGRADINIGWLFGLKFSATPTLTLYGELFVDDAPYKREADENPRIGGIIGFDRNGRTWRFITEGAFVTRYTYSYYPDRLELSWFYNSYPLGPITGTDFIKISSFVMKRGEIGAFGYIETLLQGEGRMGEPFCVGNLSRKVLLSGSVKKVFRLEAGLSSKIRSVNMLIRTGLLAGDERDFLAGINLNFGLFQ